MHRKDPVTDRQFMRAAVEDPACLSAVVERYRGSLLAFVFRYVGDRETAEDIVQETFLRALRHRQKLAGVRYVSTWFHTIAANMAKSELRRRKRWRQEALAEDEGWIELVDGGAKPDQQTDTWYVQREVAKAIGDLPEKFREPLLLRDLNQLSYGEIASVLKCPEGTIKSRVSRGRRRLQVLLRPLAGEVFALNR